MSGKLSVVKKKRLVDKIYTEYVKQMTIKRKEVDFRLSDLTNDSNYKLLTEPERYLLFILQERYGEIEGNKKFQQYEGFSQKNALLTLLNNPNNISDFLNMGVTSTVMVDGVRTVKQIPMLEYLIRQGFNALNQEEMADLRLDPKAVTSVLKAKIQSELGIKPSLEYEETNDKQGVDDSNAINHYEAAQGKIKLVLESLIQRGDVTNPKGFKNATEYLNSIFDMVKKLKDSDAETFFKALKGSYPALWSAIGMNNLEANPTSPAVEELVAFQNSFFQFLSKQTLDYQILKVVNNDLDSKENYVSLISALEDKATDNIIDEWISKINVNNIQSIDKVDLGKLFNISGSIVEALRKDSTFINDNLKYKRVGKLRNNFKKAALMKYNSSTNKVKTVLSLVNAEGKSIYSIQNFSSLMKRYEEYVPNNNSPVTLSSKSGVKNLVPFLGIQSKSTTIGETTWGDTQVKNESDAINSAKLDEFDIQSLSFHAVMKAITDKDTGGFMPFLFSGDKSSYWGIPIHIKERPKGQMTGLYREYFKGVLNNELSRYHAYKESTKQKTYVKGNAVLPFYSFLETANKDIYKQILASNGGVTDELMNTILSLVDNRIRNQAYGITSYFDINNLNKGEYTSDTDMYDYALITTVGMMEQSQHLTGDMMYYNDFTKRIPAIASTKETLNLSDNAIKFYNKNLKVKNEKPINAKEFNTLVINDVYIKTEEMTSEGDLKDYSKNNSADAQAYISLNTAKFILFSSGRWNNDYKMLFEQIERDNLSAKDFTRIHNEINEHLNALKPQYYGFYNGTNIPIFYKMSVVPLYEGYTRGKNLDKIRTMMNENGLNMVIFESGNKVGKKVGNGSKISDVNKEGEVTLSMYDKDMNFNPSYAREISKGNYEYSTISNMGQAITDFKQVSPWKYFGVQVETNNQKNKNIFGTQMRVLGLIDLMEDPDIDKKAKAMFAKNGVAYDSTISSLQNISRYFDSLINEKYRKDKNKLMNKLGLDDDYTPIDEKTSKEKIKQTLIDQAIGSGATIEFINQLRNLDSYDMVTNKVKLQSIVQKMLDLTKQKLFGEPKVQVASTFFEPSNSNILSTRLKAYKSDDEFYMEVYLPLEYAEQYGDLINDKFDSDGILRPKAGINIDVMTMIGYRIPTQYVNALDKIRVMGFVPGVSRNQVIVPAEITTKTGSDFDVDKLNMFFPKITRTKKPTADQVREGLAPALKESLKLLKKHTEQGENVDYEQGLIESILENFDVVDELSSFGEDELSDVERNILNEVHKFIKANTTLEVNMSNIDNRIIQFYSDILTFRKNLVISPNEQTIVKPAIREIENAQDKVNGDGFKYNAFDIFWLNNRRNSFMTAKSTLGIQALAQKHHALCQIYDIKINDAETAYKLGDKNDTRAIKLSTLLSFFSNDFKPNAVYDFGRTRDLSGKSIISKVISETIDAAKDDYIASANFRNETANVFNLLIRLGINYKVALNFIAQPGIVDMIRNKRISKSTTSDAGRFAYESIDLRNIKFKKTLNAEILLEQINKEKVSYDFQESARQLFIALNQHASILSDFTKISTFDTKGIGTSIDENQLMLNNYEVNKNKIFNYFKGSKEMFEGEGHTTFLETFKNVSQQSNKFTTRFFDFERLVLNDYLPQFKKYIDEKFNDKRKTDLKKTQERQRAKDLAITFLMQQHLLKNGTDVKDLAVNLSNRIKEARTKIHGNFLLDNLVASNTSEGITSIDRKEINNILLYNSAKLEREEANDYTDSWKELYDLDKNIALDLAKLVVFQSGIINSPVTIYNLIPLEIKEELGIESFDMLDFDLTTSDDIITKVVKNNIENKNIFNRTLVINENWRNLGEGLQQRLEAKGVTSKMWDDLRKDYSHLDESVLLEKIMEC